jgi:hypothetical protein
MKAHKGTDHHRSAAKHNETAPYHHLTAARQENGADQMSAGTEETTAPIQNFYLVTLDLVQYCNAKLLEFARINNEAAFNYAHELSDVRSPSEFIEITTRHAREQLAVLREQAKEVATLGQKATLKTAEPFKSESGTGGGVGGN